MDIRLAFTEFLFAFCAVVLADRVYGVFSRLGAAFGLTRPLAEMADAVTAGSRGDWYVHFSRDAITGQPTAVTRPAPAARPAGKTRPVRDARPRLHAR
ncbi:MAG: hypothetical protein ACP59X_04075 [Solidesulfovibrio sp. DCME]|uniref:hypothetical protein n=1 Tax=Solidesulfovibrio sp. DCME TaxID=3447380 RepID=UPI003D14BA02